MSSFLPLLDVAAARIRPPIAIVLGAPRSVVEIVRTLNTQPITCYQMDLFQAERLRNELAAASLFADVQAAPDLWDLPATFQTVLFPAPPRGERELKLDMVDQGFHLLVNQGTFVVLSTVRNDQLFPGWMKKVFGKSAPVHTDAGSVIWSVRTGNRERRRHEMIVQARIDDGEPLRFITRPGVFTFGRMDLGTRALLAAAEIKPGDRILDLGCGAGAAGLAASRRAWPGGHVTFIDSNLRAVALAEKNARQCGLANHRTLAAVRLEGLEEDSFDVVLANPPYHAHQAIAQMFIERSKDLLRKRGRFYLVTKQLDFVEPIVRRAFDEPELFENRGYIIIAAEKK